MCSARRAPGISSFAIMQEILIGEVEIIGLRPGEKRHEELTTQGLTMRRTAHPRIASARQRPVAADRVSEAVRQARRACARGSASLALESLTGLVDDFRPSDAAMRHAAADAVAHQVSAA